MSGATFSSSASSTLSLSVNTDAFRRSSVYARAYFYVFLLGMVLCWSPSKPLAYLAPWLGIGLFLLLTRSQRVLARVLLILLIWAAPLPLYALLTPGFVLHSAMLTLLTYGTFIFLFAIPTKPLANPRLSERMLTVARWVLLFEASWGILQGLASASRTGTFDGATGDAVAGTIRPFTVYPDFSNAMFATNVALLLLCLFPSFVQERKGKLPVLLGSIALILASVLHVLLLLAISVAVAFVLYYPGFFKRKAGLFSLFGLSVLALLAVVLLSNNFATVNSFARQTIAGETPRSQTVSRVVTEATVQYPWLSLIGIGPGQFSSRAGLIGTGMYFGGPENPKPIPLLPQGMSTPFEEYVLDTWLRMALNPTINDTSSTYKPFFSWLSIYVEWGLIGVLLALGITGNLLWRVWRRRSYSSQRLQSAMISAGIMFIFLLGIQENYWEVSQAIFVGTVLLKMQYATLRCTTPNRSA